MKNSLGDKFSLGRVRFEPWSDREAKNLPYGQFSFFISLQTSSSATVTPESLLASFTDSTGIEWDYYGTEVIYDEETWKAEILFQTTNLNDSADLLIEHGKLSVSICNHSGTRSQCFDIYHDGPLGNLTSKEIAV